MQLAVDVQIPSSHGGLDGECIYIDTEGSFHIERLKTIAEGLYTHLTNITKKKRKANESNTNTSESNRKENEEALLNKTPDNLMNGIYFIRVHDSTELLAVINRLSSLIDQSPKVKLVIIDSIAFPFRQSLHDVAWRTRILGGIAQTLQQVAYEKNIAVVVTNHVTTKFNKSKVKSVDVDIELNERQKDDLDKVLVNEATIREIWNTTSHLVPALGETWSHAVTNRLMMHYHLNERCASLMKSPNMKCSTTVFNITEFGVRDVSSKKEVDPNKISRI